MSLSQRRAPGLNENDPAYAGQARYTPRFLRHVYDPLVLRFVNPGIWRCPTNELVAHYDRNVGRVHLDVGPGTGYFLDHCRWPVEAPELTLLDLNADVLRAAAGRIGRLQPALCRANVLDECPLPHGRFDSIAVNYVLHCLPGTMESKAAVFANLAPLLAPGGRLFGSTVLFGGVAHSRGAQRLLARLNRKGVFCNRSDDLPGLERALGSVFERCSVRTRGSVALFEAGADLPVALA